jgi:ATP-dependent Clp protease ATP-binding subunit ClpX
MSPEQMYNSVSEIVEGQDEAKKLLCTAVYNHYKRVFFHNNDEIELDKSNILMIGKSGSGKTLMVETLSKILGVPFVKIDSNTLTEVGYVGEDAEVCIQRLFQVANYNVQKTEQGIVFLDEIDKIRRSNTSGGQKDISGEGVQQSLLKLIEGTTVNVQIGSGSKRISNAETKQINTKNILFICAGAFEDLLSIIEQNLNAKHAGLNYNFNRGFTGAESRYDDLMKYCNQEHLTKYGFIPEFLGRLPILITLKELTENDLISIMIKPKNALLKQYQKLLKIKDDCSLEWTDKALEIIAKNAKKNNTGARGLRQQIEKLLLKTMYDIPSQKSPLTVLIDEDVASGIHQPKLTIIEPQQPSNVG